MIGPAAPGETDRLYSVLRRAEPALIGADGKPAPLPESLSLFLSQLVAGIGEARSVTILRNQSTLTTIEAADLLGVSRQFLVNLLEKGEIPFHKVGTHRRIYADDLFRYKATRDSERRSLLRGLAAAEAAEGIYDRVPLSPETL